MELLKSASKVVFILMASASVAALFFNKIGGEQFMVLVSMAFAFYFSNKGEVANTKLPYAGK